MNTAIVVRAGFAVVVLVACAIPLACFSLKEPPCAFSCLQPPNRCPENYTCEADGLCHHHGDTGSCFLTPAGDAGTDLAPTSDTASTTD